MFCWYRRRRENLDHSTKLMIGEEITFCKLLLFNQRDRWKIVFNRTTIKLNMANEAKYVTEEI